MPQERKLYNGQISNSFIDPYRENSKNWNPDKFDAKEWVRVAKKSGCRYIIFLTRDGTGFCLWDTKQSDWTTMNMPFKKDVMKELAAACKEQGIGLVAYYQNYRRWKERGNYPFVKKTGGIPAGTEEQCQANMEEQIIELGTNYGPLVGFWPDNGMTGLKQLMRSLQPDCVVVRNGDFDTPEQHMCPPQFKTPWESCDTIGASWAWDKGPPNTPAKCIRNVVFCAVGDGNYALDTGPMADGRLDPRHVEVFLKIGEWLEKYGESIYGTRGGPFVSPGAKGIAGNSPSPEGPWWGGSTRKGNAIYLHILRWPSDAITVPAIKPRIVKHTVLTGGEATVKQTDAGIEVSVPADKRDALDTIIKLELDGPAKDIPPMIMNQNGKSEPYNK